MPAKAIWRAALTLLPRKSGYFFLLMRPSAIILLHVRRIARWAQIACSI